MEIPLAKRAGDMLAALLQVIQNPKQAKEFLKDLEVSVEEFRKIELNGIELKRLKQWDAELQSREADVNGRFDEVSRIKPQALKEAEVIVSNAQEHLKSARQQNEDAEKLKDEAEQLYGNEARRLKNDTEKMTRQAEQKLAHATDLETVAINKANAAEQSFKEAEKLKEHWTRKLQAIQQAAQTT